MVDVSWAVVLSASRPSGHRDLSRHHQHGPLESRRGPGCGAAAGLADPSSQPHGPCHADRGGAAAGNLVLAGRCDLAFRLPL